MRENHLKILQYVTGIGLFFLVGGYHLLLMHLGKGDPASWSSVAQRAASAGWLAIYILLIFGFYHGLHGVRGLILELSLPNRSIKVLNWSIVLGGLAVFGYAIYIPVHAF
jgi:succinate dehydrogenase hydrophobic anchor subunit